MNLVELLQKPAVNAIIGGLIIYLMIYLSNLGNPILGAILSGMPVGLLGLIALENNDIKKKYSTSAIYINIIIVIMWIINNYNATHIENTSYIVAIGFAAWVILSIIYYKFSKHLH